MAFEPFKHKTIAVLNKKIETGRAMNALAHMALGLSRSVPQEQLRLQDYTDADEGRHPQISDIPFIILRATSEQLRKLRNEAIERNITHTDFTDTMIGETYIDQHENTKSTKEQDLTYFGVCMFGDWDEISALTKKFSLWR
ncbi:MAG: DUF2000 domain-containing protein [Candidatus Woesearchaeota archaeon]|nr:DUF2000 domain-containing protein [Candidatus Woesearchaeota archaeon]